MYLAAEYLKVDGKSQIVAGKSQKVFALLI